MFINQKTMMSPSVVWLAPFNMLDLNRSITKEKLLWAILPLQSQMSCLTPSGTQTHRLIDYWIDGVGVQHVGWMPDLSVREGLCLSVCLCFCTSVRLTGDDVWSKRSVC